MTNPPKNDTPDKALVPLQDCPPGLFRFSETIGFKTEYGMMICDENGAEMPGHLVRFKVSNYPDAYVLESGEVFWGGAKSHADRSGLLVEPLALAALSLPNGHKVYWADDRFEQPGVHVWNGSTHDHYVAKPTPTDTADLMDTITADHIAAQAGEVKRRPYREFRAEVMGKVAADRREAVANAITSNIRLEWRGHDHASINPRSVSAAVDAIASLIAGPPEGFNEARQAWERILDGMKRFGMESEAIETVDAYFARPGEPA